MLRRLAVAPPPEVGEILSSWLWRLAVANDVPPGALLEGAGLDVRDLPADIDVGPRPLLIEMLARLTGVDAQRIMVTMLLPYPDLVRPKVRTAFCPTCWAVAIQAGRPIYFTDDAVRVGQFLCPVHHLPLVSGPAGLFLQPIGNDLVKVLRVLALEGRAFVAAAKAAGLPDLHQLQSRVQGFLGTPWHHPHKVGTALVRILRADKTIHQDWFARLEMPNSSPAPSLHVLGLMHSSVEHRRAVYVQASRAIVSGRLPPERSIDRRTAESQLITATHLDEDRRTYLRGLSRYDDAGDLRKTGIGLSDLVQSYAAFIRKTRSRTVNGPFAWLSDNDIVCAIRRDPNTSQARKLSGKNFSCHDPTRSRKFYGQLGGFGPGAGCRCRS